MRATLYNESSRPLNAWATVTVPLRFSTRLAKESTFQLDDGRRFRVVRGRTQGTHGIVAHIDATLEGHELVNGSFVDEKHSDVAPYAVHPWVTDDVNALMPKLVGLADNQQHISEGIDVARRVDKSEIGERWFTRRRIPELGLILECWTDVQHNKPFCPWVGKVVWSQRDNPRFDRIFQAIGLRTGEYFAFDFARALGISEPNWLKDDWFTLLAQNIGFTDGSALPISGRILATPQIADFDGDMEDLQDPVAWSYHQLLAASEGTILGVCHDWDSSWLGNHDVPRLSVTYARQVADADWADFQSRMSTTRGWYAERPLGVTSTPSQTGGQNDFGASKGTLAVVAHDPRQLRILQYSVLADCFRGFMHYEADGTPIDLEDHPQWVTWKGQTHHNHSVSPDRLGKQSKGWRPKPLTGFDDYDDEHRSQLHLQAYYALSDDPLVADIFEHQSKADAASYRIKYPSYGTGAARAQGRVLGCLANALRLADGDAFARWARVVASRLNTTKSNPLLNVAGPVKVLASIPPDARKNVRDGTGKLLPSWSVWEHGLAAVALYTAFKAAHDYAFDVLRKICRTVVEQACFEEEGVWYICDDIAYLGEVATPVKPSTKSTYHVVRRGLPGTTSWAFLAVLIAAEISDEQDPVHAKARQVIDQFTPQVPDDAIQDIAEWWCIVKAKTVRP